MKPINFLAMGDMSFESKLLGMGVACKVKHHLCPWCEVHRIDNMWLTCRDVDVCEFCKHNKKVTCTLQDINDQTEVQRKGFALLDLNVEDRSAVSGDHNLMLQVILPVGEVDCFDGWDDETMTKKWWKEFQIPTINNNATLSLPIHDYCRNLSHSEEEDTIINNAKIF
jgi:hypothetical protein